MHFYWRFDSLSRKQRHYELILCVDVQVTVICEPKKGTEVCI